MAYIFANYNSMCVCLRQDMGFTLYFQPTNYQKNQFYTFAAINLDYITCITAFYFVVA